MLSLQDAIRPTTLIVSSKLRDHLGLDITIAAETFQHTGSFKFRAAYNLALNVANDEILSASSGNFGQGLAYACKLLGKKCTVVMPSTSAKVKVDAVRSFGAVADLIDTSQISRFERVEELSIRMPNAYVASAYDDQLVIDGNATLGEELAEYDFDAVVVPVGGGGLIAGTINGLKSKASKTEVIGAEPLLANDAARSFRAGKVIANEKEPTTIADGARTVSLGKLNWPIIKDGAADIIEASDEKIIEALQLYFSLANLKSEPTGAVSLAAVLEDTARFKDRKICVIVSGGNVDGEVYRNVLAQ